MLLVHLFFNDFIGARVCRPYRTSYGGSGKSYNSFESQDECQSKCEAHMPRCVTGFDAR